MSHWKTYLFVLLFAAPAVLHAQDTDSLTYKADQYFGLLAGMQQFNGNVVIAKNGKLILDKSYNMPGAPDSMKINRDSRFIIASLSKLFIKYAVMQLVQEKRLALNDTLGRFLPGFAAGSTITVEQLMYHRSGLPRELKDHEQYRSISLEKAVELAKKEALEYEPGTYTLYSNVGYFLLHAIIQQASGKPYAVYMQKLLRSMKLSNTGEYNANRIKDLVKGYDREEGRIVAAPPESTDRFETGNFYSTTADLYAFSEHVLSGKTLDVKLARSLFVVDSMLMQAGGRAGYRAYFCKHLKSGFTIIFLANYSAMPFQNVTDDIRQLLNKKAYPLPEPVKRVEISLPDSVLHRYVGRYALEVDRRQVFTISLEAGKLYTGDGDEKTEMHADTETSFFDEPGSKDGCEFTLDPLTGKYNLVLISTGLRLKTVKLE